MRIENYPTNFVTHGFLKEKHCMHYEVVFHRSGKYAGSFIAGWALCYRIAGSRVLTVFGDLNFLDFSDCDLFNNLMVIKSCKNGWRRVKSTSISHVLLSHRLKFCRPTVSECISKLGRNRKK